MDNEESSSDIDLNDTILHEEDNSPPPAPTYTLFTRKDGSTLNIQNQPVHSLWAHHIWSAGKSLANFLDLHPELVEGKRVLELGAAASLPSFVATYHSPARVVSTDYPDPVLIDTITKNIKANDLKNIVALPFLWGADTAILDPPFDIILIADIIFNFSEHSSLLKSIVSVLAPRGKVITTFSHHLPQHRERDLKFFEIATEMSLNSKLLYKETWPEMFSEDSGDLELRRTVFCYELST